MCPLLTAALFAPCLPSYCVAQTHVVKKTQDVVRAVGVYEWTGDPAKPKASRVIPVTLFIDGELRDAGVYLARPVPLALETGNVFEAEKAGVPAGTLEVSFARDYKAGDPVANASPADHPPDGAKTAPQQFDEGWEGAGVYKPKPAERLMAEKPSGPLSKIVVSGGKSGPKFGTKPGDASSADANGVASIAGDAKTKAADADASEKNKADRAATLSRKNDPKQNGEVENPQASAQENAQDSAQDNPDDKADRPTLRKRTDGQREAARKKQDTASVKAPTTAEDDPDRPTLHRGKPAGSMSEDDLAALHGIPADMQQMVLVSDAATRTEHDFARTWNDDAERLSMKAKLEAIARQKLQAYGIPVGPPVNVAVPAAAAAPAKKPGDVAEDRTGTMNAPPVLRRGVPTAPDAGGPASPPKPTSGAKAGASTTQTSPAGPRKIAKGGHPGPIVKGGGALSLTDVDLRGFTLSYGGLPTFYYSATAPGRSGPDRYVTVVAQQEPAGDLHVALASVTDSAHLDRTPRARLVDVVDAEASNRASLLMELRAVDTRQFALYRVIGAQAEQTFLNGSSQ